jgi:hypothetical protein
MAENAQWVKPLTPDMIPEGHRPEWNAETAEWEFFVIEEPQDTFADYPTPTE